MSDDPDSEQALRLLKAFFRIEDPKLRQKIVALVEAAARSVFGETQNLPDESE
jgi:hypothetical protein